MAKAVIELVGDQVVTGIKDFVNVAGLRECVWGEGEEGQSGEERTSFHCSLKVCPLFLSGKKGTSQANGVKI